MGLRTGRHKKGSGTVNSPLARRKLSSKKKKEERNGTYPDTDGADGDRSGVQQHKVVQILKDMEENE